MIFTAILIAMQGISSYPYLSGYTWAHACDWALANPEYGNTNYERFDPRDVQAGDTILVEYDSLETFAISYLPKIQHPVILISPNYGYHADNSLPGPFAYLLQNPKIAAWFVQNIDRPPTDRLIPIPIGVGSHHWYPQLTSSMNILVPKILHKDSRRDIFVYLNLALTSAKRTECINHFQSIGVPQTPRRSFEDYLSDLSRSVFVVSPHGNGLDCHRTWEALLLGCYPIVKRSTLDPLYEGLPVVIVDEWSDVTQEFLQRKYKELRGKTWPREPFYASYWFQKVTDLQQKIRGIPLPPERHPPFSF